ncbi:hypothetical protein SAMN05216360_105128 [Methylobacterium phyllostachyos]|uniref:Uncharacterized protein n=1 Tax=Methylobacterium phyllostachyos TaxID=582672 RepID=A0A1G9Y2I6_9HYPH|nr:hypothetical protein [Methylobacterium phyllostachyos]SDN02876.1 hypothetical protein SAMN05216360_105128 [Methylobacterium phyllostachyos]
MPLIRWLISKTLQTFLGSAHARRSRAVAQQREDGTFEGASATEARNFEDRYAAAVRLLRTRIDQEFPDAYYARLSSGRNSSYDYGQDRALAIDTMSIAIALALRNGATVQQAANAGAASIALR